MKVEQVKTYKIKLATFCTVFLFSTFIHSSAANPAGNDEITKVVSVLETAFKNKDRELLESCIAPDFSVSTATMPGALNYVDNIWKHIPQIDSIRFVPGEKITDNQKGSTAAVMLFIAGKTPVKTDVAFNKEFKVRYIGHFDQLYGMFRNRPSVLKGVIPFEHEENAIIITLKINDSNRPLRFLFDTGADGMAISKQLADSLGMTVSREQNTSIVGANRSISVSSGNTVHLDTLSLPSQNIALFEEMGRYDGIIGLNLAKHFIVKVDFNKEHVLLYDLGTYTPAPDETAVPITVPDGVIRIPAELDLLGKGAIAGNFVFDTGAAFHLVAFSPFVRKNRLLLGGFKYESQNSMASMGHHTLVYQGKAVRFSFGGMYFEQMPITLQASSGNNNWDPGADGSIGFQLIKDFNFTINLVEKEIYLEKK